MAIRYQLLSPTEWSVLLNVEEDTFDEAIIPERAVAYLADPTNLLLVAMDGKTVIGQCAACIHRHPDRLTELYIDNLGVSDGFKRRGIGRELITRMFSEGKSRGCEEAWVATEVDNDPANRLYEQFRSEPAEKVNMHSYRL